MFISAPDNIQNPIIQGDHTNLPYTNSALLVKASFAKLTENWHIQPSWLLCKCKRTSPPSQGISKNSDFLRETLRARLHCTGLHSAWFKDEKIPCYLHGNQRAWPRYKVLTRCPWGQDQHWLLLCLKVCVICFHKALTVFSREIKGSIFQNCVMYTYCNTRHMPSMCYSNKTHKCLTSSFRVRSSKWEKIKG